MQTESSNLIMNGLNPPTHHQVTEQLMVPDQLVGLIIGKQGEVGNPEPWRIVLVPKKQFQHQVRTKSELFFTQKTFQLKIGTGTGKTVPVLVPTVPVRSFMP